MPWEQNAETEMKNMGLSFVFSNFGTGLNCLTGLQYIYICKDMVQQYAYLILLQFWSQFILIINVNTETNKPVWTKFYTLEIVIYWFGLDKKKVDPSALPSIKGRWFANVMQFLASY